MIIHFIQQVRQRRLYILIALLALTIYGAFSVRMSLIGDNESNWIKGSKEYLKLRGMDQNEVFVKKIIFPIPLDDVKEKEFMELEKVYRHLEKNGDIYKISSIFTYPFVVKHTDGESSFTQVMTLAESEEGERYKLFRENIAKFRQFNNAAHERICFYLLSKSENRIQSVPTTLNYSITNPKANKNGIGEGTLLAGLIVTLFVILLVAFKNLSAPLSGVIFIAVTMVWTTLIFEWIMDGASSHISILILSFCVSLIDYIYIYYNWFISHKYYSREEALPKTIDRTFVPIFLTTVINIVGFALLLFSESYMLQSLSIMVIIASIVGLVLNFTLLPAMLSFCTVEKPSLLSEKVSGFLTRRIRHYNHTVAKIFFAAVALLGIVTLLSFYQSSYYVKTAQSSRLIKVLIDSSELDMAALREIEKLVAEIEPSDDVVKIDSIYHALKEFHRTQSTEPFDLAKIDIDQYAFMLDLSGGLDKYREDGKFIIDIHSHDLEAKKRLLGKMRKGQVPIVIKDMDSLLQSAKLDTINVMIALVLFMIAVVGAIVMWLTRRVEYLAIAMLVNAVPLVIFFSFVFILSIPVKPEIFISMIIAIAIANDATIHFIYYHNRFCGHFDVKGRTGVYELFTFVGSPLLLGNLILAFVFLLLVFTHVPSITAIGLFSAVLVILSILTDIFIMPVLFLRFVAKK